MATCKIVNPSIGITVIVGGVLFVLFVYGFIGELIIRSVQEKMSEAETGAVLVEWWGVGRSASALYLSNILHTL